MKFAKLYRKCDAGDYALWHWDLEARHILVEKRPRTMSESGGKDKSQKSTSEEELRWTITGIVDWDDALAVPRVLARAPPTFLWFGEEDRNKGANWEEITI
jgi:hypothetical protein